MSDLPEPARLYLRHAIAPGTPRARSVWLRAAYRMRPKPGGPLIDLVSEEILTPFESFVWTARFRMGPVPMRVRDHYAHGDGAMSVRALGFLPVGGSKGPDVARSARYRLAAESVWLPSAFLPGERARWEPVDDERARVTLTVDGEDVPIVLKVDASGRLVELTMERRGNVGVEAWQPIPYGFAVEEERTVDGHTVPWRLRGGWWYGTERFRDDDAVVVRVEEIRFTW
jgi:hypothetical protein